MKTIAFISLAAVLLCASCDTATPPSFDGPGDSVSIAHLKSLYRGSATRITSPITVSGVVIANDILDEFPYTLILQDATGGIEVAVNHNRICSLFPLGCTVEVSCSGLALGDYGGKIRLGATPTGSYSVDRIATVDIGRYLRRAESEAERKPASRSFSKIGPADVDTYVQFEQVGFAEAGAAWCDNDPETGKPVTTSRILTDGAGGEFPVRIAGTSHYATEPIPQGTGSVNGIIDYFGGEYSLRIVNYETFFAISAAPPTTYPSAGEYSYPSPTR